MATYYGLEGTHRIIRSWMWQSGLRLLYENSDKELSVDICWEKNAILERKIERLLSEMV